MNEESGRNEERVPPHFAELNRQYYYQEEGPSDYIITRLHALALIGGKYNEFIQLVAEGLDFSGFQTKAREPMYLKNETTKDIKERNIRGRDHFVRIEAHHLKHLAIETLLRLYLAHRHGFQCPWYEISRHTHFGKFKKLVRSQIIHGDRELLKTSAALVFMGPKY